MTRLFITLPGEVETRLTVESEDEARCRQVARWLLRLVAEGLIPEPDQTDEATMIALLKLGKKKRQPGLTEQSAAARRAVKQYRSST